MLTYFKISDTDYGVNYVNNNINITLNYRDSSLIFKLNDDTIDVNQNNFFDFIKKYIQNYDDVYSTKYLYAIILYSIEIHSYVIKNVNNFNIFHFVHYSDHEFIEPITVNIIFE